MHGSIQTWTPERARKTLATATHKDNRRISKAKVREYANRMQAGEWRTTGEGLVFTEDGMLMNGHHRLAAIVTSGVTLDLFTVVGESPENFAHYDQGLKRNAAQFYPGKEAHAKSSAISKIKAITGTSAPGSAKGANNKATLAEQLAAQEEWGGAVEAVWDGCSRVYRATRISVSSLAAVMAVALSQGHAEKVQEFLKGLETGANLPAGDPRLALRNRWAVDGRTLNSNERYVGLGIIARAWNAFVQGQSKAHIKFTEKHTFPGVL